MAQFAKIGINFEKVMNVNACIIKSLHNAINCDMILGIKEEKHIKLGFQYNPCWGQQHDKKNKGNLLL